MVNLTIKDLFHDKFRVVLVILGLTVSLLMVHVGMGMIGEVGFRNILDTKLGQLPLILETPRDARRDDAANLLKIMELAGAL